MQVEVHHVDPEVAGPRDAEQRVQVGAVAVDQPAPGVHDLRDPRDVLLEEAERARVGDHQRRDLGRHALRDLLGMQHAVLARRHRDHGVAVERGAGGVGAVRGVGDQHLAPLLAALLVVGADHHDPRQLALGAGRRLERHAVHPADLGELALELPGELEEALQQGHGLHRVRRGKASQSRDLLVDLRVVLHRAGAERIEAEVDRGVPGREPREVPDHVHFGELREPFEILAQRRASQHRRGVALGDVARRERESDAPRTAALEAQRLLVGEAVRGVAHPEPAALVAHRAAPASAPISRSIAARVASSVVQTSTAPPSSGACGDRSSPPTMPSPSARPSAASASPLHADHELVEGLGREREREPRRRAHPRLGVLGLGQVALGQAPQSDPAQQREVDGRHQQTQALVGADVRGRPLAPDVLLARREREHEAAPSLAVHGLSDQAAGQVADEGHAGRHEAEVRTAEADGDAEALGLAAHDVGAQLSGRAQQRERERLGHDHHELGAVRVRGRRRRRDVLERAPEVRLLQHHAGGLGVDQPGQRRGACRRTRAGRPRSATRGRPGRSGSPRGNGDARSPPAPPCCGA